ncbi:hypothetical protein BB559_000134 [Furculomyces boomerangus]|uniref:Ribosomal silencing factor RsfS n=2 Tax=Harpellales TaxID=61421 RepID=A0A2T9Z657_9FUNG|nr:hypothetical protein BB559_000134 [Furculomyces boomerangus]PWA03368.1 hypothetical protein BB558_000477 [Smittium angustum]
MFRSTIFLARNSRLLTKQFTNNGIRPQYKLYSKKPELHTTPKIDILSELNDHHSELIDKNTIPGLFPESDLDSTVEILESDQADHEWFVDQAYSIPTASDSVPLWKQRALEAIDIHSTEFADILISGFEPASLASAVVKILETENTPFVTILDVTSRCEWTDRMVIAEAISIKHMQSMAQELLTKIKNLIKQTNPNLTGYSPIVDGLHSDEWVAIDFGSVVVHIMTKEARELYKLEELWSTEMKLKSEDQNDMAIKEHHKTEPQIA